MTLTVNSVGPNNQTPGIAAELFVPDQLVAGRAQLVTLPITLGAGTLKRGTVVGQQNAATGTAVATAIGTNTGNGTFGTITPAAIAVPGNYQLIMEDATHFIVMSPVPNEGEVGHGVAGTAFNAGGLSFTLTAGGTAFVAGDSFNIAVTAATTAGNYIQSVRTATDGSQIPSGILVDDADASGGPVTAAIYASGEFNANAVIFDASWTINLLTPLLRDYAMFLKTSLTANPET